MNFFYSRSTGIIKATVLSRLSLSKILHVVLRNVHGSDSYDYQVRLGNYLFARLQFAIFSNTYISGVNLETWNFSDTFTKKIISLGTHLIPYIGHHNNRQTKWSAVFNHTSMKHSALKYIFHSSLRSIVAKTPVPCRRTPSTEAAITPRN